MTAGKHRVERPAPPNLLFNLSHSRGVLQYLCMPEPPLLQLAQELEWLGCELEHYGQLHAEQGFPQSGPAWEAFCEKQRGVLVTTDKIEREVKSGVRYNPARLVGVEYPLEDTFNSIANLIGAVEEIKQCTVFAVDALPAQVRAFTKLVEGYLQAMGSVAR